jgi:uncharacterized protein
MISVQNLLGRDDRFFGLLEASAEEAHASARALHRFCRGPAGAKALEEFAVARRQEKHLAQEISEQVLKTFVTSLEREDIVALSQALYRIPKTIEKFGERFHIFQRHLAGTDFGRQARLVEEATAQVAAMVGHLRKGTHLEKIKDENHRLQQLEGQADKLMLELLRQLYQSRPEPLRLLALKELYELLEKVIDRCRDAGNVVTHIVLKHS